MMAAGGFSSARQFRWPAMALLMVACVVWGGGAAAQGSGRLLATGGVSQIEGAGGGGLVPWALITGYGTRDQVGADIHGTVADTADFVLSSLGASVGLYDRIEFSYAHEWFDTGRAGARLGLGQGYQFHLDVAGAKLRLFGDAVFDQDSLLPEVSVGTQFKAADRHAVLDAIGARSPDGVDYYIAASKLFLSESLLVNATLRATKANQFGLLGFGGDRNDSYKPEFEASVALLLSRRLAVGAEVRTKPDNLGFAREGPAFDAFAAYFFNKHVSATLAFVALGPIARQGEQNGVYFSLQSGF
jgi:hypothetical protein